MPEQNLCRVEKSFSWGKVCDRKGAICGARGAKSHFVCVQFLIDYYRMRQSWVFRGACVGLAWVGLYISILTVSCSHSQQLRAKLTLTEPTGFKGGGAKKRGWRTGWGSKSSQRIKYYVYWEAGDTQYPVPITHYPFPIRPVHQQFAQSSACLHGWDGSVLLLD